MKDVIKLYFDKGLAVPPLPTTLFNLNRHVSEEDFCNNLALKCTDRS